MKARLKQLREKAGALNTQIKAKADEIGKEGRTWTAEDETEWKRLNAEYDANADAIDKIQRALEIDARMQAPAGDRRIGRDDQGKQPCKCNPDEYPDENGKCSCDSEGEDEAASDKKRSLAFRSWLQSAGGRSLNRDQVQACRELQFNPRARVMEFNLLRTEDVRAIADEIREMHPRLKKRALSAITGNAGGVTVPSSFLNVLERNMLFYGTALQEITIIRTENGAPLPMPYADDTSNEGEIVGESADMDGSTDPTFGVRTLGAFKFSSKMVKVPTEFIEDGAFDVVNYVGEILGERLGRIKNRKVTLGTGVKQPRGYMVDAAIGVTAASATAITGDEIAVDLVHSLDPAYREGATFAMHDSVLAHIRRLKDGEGRYLFASNLAEGYADTIAGRRFWINQHMDSSVASGKKTIAFGNFKKVIGRSVRGVRLKRLDERYAEKDQVAFLALERFDSGTTNAGTNPVKYLQQL